MMKKENGPNMRQHVRAFIYVQMLCSDERLQGTGVLSEYQDTFSFKNGGIYV